MASKHLSAGQVTSLLPAGDRLVEERSAALFKGADLEVMRIVLRKDHSLSEHQVAGKITIQCLQGSIELFVQEGATRMNQGDFLHLRGGGAAFGPGDRAFLPARDDLPRRESDGHQALIAAGDRKKLRLPSTSVATPICLLPRTTVQHRGRAPDDGRTLLPSSARWFLLNSVDVPDPQEILARIDFLGSRRWRSAPDAG